MTPTLNLTLLLGSALLMTLFYLLSVSPAALSRRLGPRAYPLCGVLRGIAMLFELVAALAYAGVLFWPVSGFAATFPWPWWGSGLIAVAIGAPSFWLMLRGLRDAGLESAVPQPGQPLYGGIYTHIRHPQAAGEVWLWWVIAFALHSPFLALISFIWPPLFLLMALAEERDLLLRHGAAYAAYRRRTGMFWPKRQPQAAPQS